MMNRPPAAASPPPPPGLVWPSYDQVVGFHERLMAKLGIEGSGVVSEPKLRAALDRARQAAQGQRGDVVMLAAFLMFNLIREKPFLKGNPETGVALSLALILRNGGVVIAPEEELAGAGLGIAEGAVYVGQVEQWLRDSVRRAR